MRSPSTTTTIAFEFCEICKRNHDQGRRHKYFPAHIRALAALLARFKSKLSHLRHSLHNPSRPQFAPTNPLWCVFCHVDVPAAAAADFAWSGAIYHMASEGHFGNLKDFFVKHGGEKGQIDSFRVSESELAKWEKGCEALKHASSLATEGPIGSMQGPSIAMRIIGHPVQILPKLEYVVLHSMASLQWRVCMQSWAMVLAA